ncbi:hypothetical protein LIER_41208 [Lithospermum erythrorhizon]|uniref:Uncharacterized protein n=1 Tax=Lithospermum erythrorhizon TaxID=34254 RepID=A0AAV3R9Q5_LITER
MKLVDSSLNATLQLQLRTLCKTMGCPSIFLHLKWMELSGRDTTRTGLSQETHFTNTWSNLTSLGTATRNNDSVNCVKFYNSLNSSDQSSSAVHSGKFGSGSQWFSTACRFLSHPLDWFCSLQIT